MSDASLELNYRPARTVVRFDGTVTETQRHGKPPTVERESVVAITAEADPYETFVLKIEDTWKDDQALQLDLAVDQRLTGAAHDSTGVGAQLVSAAATALAVGAKLFRALEQPAASGANELTDLVRRRDAFAERVTQLQDRLTALLGNPDITAEGLETLTAALAAARAEVTTIEAAIDALWAEDHVPTTQTLSYVVGTDQLPRRSASEQTLTLNGDDRLTSTAQEVARNLGLIAVLIGSEDSDDSPPTTDDELHYRVPQRVEIAVYQAQDADRLGANAPLPTTFQLRSTQPAWVVDSRSEYRSVPLGHKLFGSHGAGVKFGDAGTLVQLTNKESSALGALATAVSAAPATAATALANAGKIEKAFAPAGDPGLAALEDEVARKELEAKLVKAKKTIAGGIGAADGR